MDDVEKEAARKEITQKFVESFKKYPNEHIRDLAAMCIGTVLGTTYATEVEKAGREAARNYIMTVFRYSELCAVVCGTVPDFAFALVKKSTDVEG